MSVRGILYSVPHSRALFLSNSDFIFGYYACGCGWKHSTKISVVLHFFLHFSLHSLCLSLTFSHLSIFSFFLIFRCHFARNFNQYIKNTYLLDQHLALFCSVSSQCLLFVCVVVTTILLNATAHIPSFCCFFSPRFSFPTFILHYFQFIHFFSLLLSLRCRCTFAEFILEERKKKDCWSLLLSSFVSG